MKYSVIKHNKNGKYDRAFDGYIVSHWLNVLDKTHTYTENHEEADFSILPINFEPEYEYDENINNIKFKNIVILDFFEYGGATSSNIQYNTFYSFFGYRLEPYDSSFDNLLAYKKLHSELCNNLKPMVRVYFKRELPKNIDLNTIEVPVYPCDYTNTFSEYNIQSESEFWNRGLDLLYIWGRSNMDRVKLHCDIFRNMDRFGHNMYSSESQYKSEFIDNNRNRGMLLLHKEWYERIDYMEYQKNSRTVIDPFGSGHKCFRNIESTINVVSFKQNPSLLLHSYEWIDGENCIYLPTEKLSNNLDIEASLDIIWDYTRGPLQSALYNIYIKSCETNLKYRNNEYLEKYFVKLILDHLI